MATDASIKANYAANADGYDQFLSTPLGTLEKQLLDQCIQSFGGFRVLDLGGGTGLRAREALAAGAESVDVVDISWDMMRQGQAHEASLGHGEGEGKRQRIRWFQGDASGSLEHLGLHGAYDVVIANGIFDHARSVAELEAMWRNTAAYLKPGGLAIANRNNPASGCAAAAAGGRYGVVFTDFDKFEGGYSFRYRMRTEPELAFESNALDVYASGSTEVPGKFFEDFKNVPWEETPVVKADPEFWKEYLADPILYIFTARKPQ